MVAWTRLIVTFIRSLQVLFDIAFNMYMNTNKHICICALSVVLICVCYDWKLISVTTVGILALILVKLGLENSSLLEYYALSLGYTTIIRNMQCHFLKELNLQKKHYEKRKSERKSYMISLVQALQTKCLVQKVKKMCLFVIYDATLLTVISSTCLALLHKY